MPVIVVKIWRFIIERTSPLIWVNILLFVALYVGDININAVRKDLDKVKGEKAVLEEKNKTLETSLSMIKAMHEDYRKLSESYLKSSATLDQKGQVKRDSVNESLKANQEAANFVIPESIRKSLEKR